MKTPVSLKIPVRLIRLPQVCDKTGLPRSGVYKRMTEDPDFPRRVQIGGRAVAWVESEVDSWVAARIENRDELIAQASGEIAARMNAES